MSRPKSQSQSNSERGRASDSFIAQKQSPCFLVSSTFQCPSTSPLCHSIPLFNKTNKLVNSLNTTTIHYPNQGSYRMGNCQAAEAATVVIHHPGNKIQRIYWSVSARQVMNSNPGHYVALVITKSHNGTLFNQFKLLRPHDTLLIGHVYRLISFQVLIHNSAPSVWISIASHSHFIRALPNCKRPMRIIDWEAMVAAAKVTKAAEGILVGNGGQLCKALQKWELERPFSSHACSFTSTMTKQYYMQQPSLCSLFPIHSYSHVLNQESTTPSICVKRSTVWKHQSSSGDS
ncbi:hypothetical protein VNO77_40978 [Canavalia gladiata]|uniref:Uncharacterized protein n=1 Tax=Canavalia gladiata TaxID=3824 RepID=A0AAN9JYX8_CANGL